MFEIGLTLLIIGALVALIGIVGAVLNFRTALRDPIGTVGDSLGGALNEFNRVGGPDFKTVPKPFEPPKGPQKPKSTGFFGKHLIFAACGGVGGLCFLTGIVLMVVSKLG